MTAEEERTRLIGDIARVLRDGPVPDEARTAALTLIGWLARRMPGEPVSLCDVNRCTGKHRGRAEPLPASGAQRMASHAELRSAPRGAPPISSRRPSEYASDADELVSTVELRSAGPRPTR
jgi:hypothetical protein